MKKEKLFRFDQFDLEALAQVKKDFDCKSENRAMQCLLRWYIELPLHLDILQPKNTVFSVSEERAKYAAHPEDKDEKHD